MLISNISCQANKQNEEEKRVSVVNETLDTVIKRVFKSHQYEIEISKLDSLKIFKTFEEFKKALLTNSSVDLIRISDLPMKGDCGFYKLYKHIDSSSNSSLGMITKEILYQTTSVLDSIELAVLLEFQPYKENLLISYNGAKYGGYLTIVDDSYFIWSVGCVEFSQEVGYGEYSITFHFHKTNNNYKLTLINCAG
jgi:hypothetical protein